MSVHQKPIKDLVISGFSGGAGKTFLIKEVIKFLSPRMEFSISTTTRSPREHEQNGIDYHFVDVEVFHKMIADHLFLEYNNPREGIYYGTTLKEYRRIKEQGKAVAFDVDYAGVVQLKEKIGIRIHTVVLKPNVETRELWMRKRGGMSEEEMAARIIYSETVERPFFERHEKDLFDKIIDPYRNDINKVPFLVHEIANELFIEHSVTL